MTAYRKWNEFRSKRKRKGSTEGDKRMDLLQIRRDPGGQRPGVRREGMGKQAE